MGSDERGRIIKFHADDDPQPTAADFLTFRCGCGCCHSGDLGACDKFELGASGHCVYCDHGQPCHERDRNRKFYNGPIAYGIRPGGKTTTDGTEYVRDRHGSLRRKYPKKRH
jgi:hypothetical protein